MKKTFFLGIIIILTIPSSYSQSKSIWKKTKTSNTIQAYTDFIKKYPDGKYIDSAKQAIVHLKTIDSLIISKAQDISAKIVPGVSLEKVLSLLSMDDIINRQSMGGIYIGMGVFPQNYQEQSTYTGTADLDCFTIVFEKGKVVSKTMNIKKIGCRQAVFTYVIK